MSAGPDSLHPVAREIVEAVGAEGFSQAELEAWAAKLARKKKDRGLFLDLAAAGIMLARRSAPRAGLHLCGLAGIGLEAAAVAQLAGGDDLIKEAAQRFRPEGQGRKPTAGLAAPRGGVGLKRKR